MSIYKEYYVSKSSERFVNKLWCLNNLDSSVPVGPKFILPNGCYNFAILEGNGARASTLNMNYSFGPGCYLCSQMTSKVQVSLGRNTKVTLVQLHAWSLSAFFKIDLNGFVDQIVRIDEKFLNENTPIITSARRTAEELVSDIELYLNKVENKPKPSLIENLCRDVLASKGEGRVTDFACKFGCSSRKLQNDFKQATGLSVKQYMDIIRLRSAVDSITDDAMLSRGISHVAMEHNYFDQTHFTKSFKKIVNLTPKNFSEHDFFLSKKN